MNPESGKRYKKFTIQTIVNPGTFYAIKYGKEALIEKKLKITQSDLEVFSRYQEVTIGQVVAVKHENKLHRGLIIDTYKRCLKPIYGVWLMDKGKNIESPADSVYILKTAELKNKKLNAYEINLYGVKPYIVDLLINSVNLKDDTVRDNFKSIFYKRESNKWSTAAYNFINDLFKSNKCLYVNPVDVNGSKITGNIYYRDESDEMLKSLAKTLCDKEFAIISKNGAKIPRPNDYRGGKYISAIERISNILKNGEWKESSIKKPQRRVARYSYNSGNSFDCGKFSCSDRERSLNNSKDQGSSPYNRNISHASTAEYFTRSFENLELAERPVPHPKVNMLKIVKRNIKLHEEHQKLENSSCLLEDAYKT